MKTLIVSVFSLAVLFISQAAEAAKINASHGRPLSAECQLSEEGDVAGEWRNVRIAIAGQPVAGADTMEEAVRTLQNMKADSICRVQSRHCEIAGEGIVDGQWLKHRIVMDGQAVTGARELGALSEKYARLRGSGLCR